jgi:hypothetical protein
MAVIEGHLGPQPGPWVLSQFEKKIDLLLELSRFDDVGVVASAGSQFVVEKVKSAWRLSHRVDLDSTSNVFSQTDSGRIG